MNVKRLHEDAVIPKYANVGDSGFDLFAIEDTVIGTGETKLIKIGLAFEIPSGYEIQIRPRLGMTLKTKLRVQLGTVDSGYRGEVGVIVDNIDQIEYSSQPRLMRGIWAGDDDFNVTRPTRHGFIKVNKGDRIAQGVLAKVEHTVFKEVNELTESGRGTGGFGSTGTN